MKGFVFRDDLTGPWVCERTGGEWVHGMDTTIGLADGDELIAGVVYSDWNGANIFMDVAGVPGKRWLNREFLWMAFHYPFMQLRCKRVSGVVAADNLPARKFNEHLGFTLEAVLEDACPTGDLLVYRMRKADCRWLGLRRTPNHGQEEQRAAGA